jgi:hypothetical protein
MWINRRLGGGVKLKRLTQEELNKIIELHAKWLMVEKVGKKADLSDCDISNLKMKGANLRWANLRGATLRGATLRGANLEGANLKGANLVRANLEGATLEWANLVRANLRGATLRGANLRGANLVEANIDYTNLPLHCGIVGIKVDERIIRQWVGHIAAFEYIGEDSDIKELLSSNLFKRIAKASHRARECGLIED